MVQVLIQFIFESVSTNTKCSKLSNQSKQLNDRVQYLNCYFTHGFRFKGQSHKNHLIIMLQNKPYKET